MKCIYLLVALSLCLLPANDLFAQAWAWGAGSHGQNGEALAPAADIWGNTYVYGTYSYGNDTLGTLILPTTSIESIIVAKYDGNGNLVWGARSQGGNAYAQWIAADNAGNAYVLASYGGTTTLGGYSLTSITGSYFLAKFTPSGSVAWMKDIGPGIAMDAEVAVRDNHIYITGDFIKPTITMGAFTCNNTDVSGTTTDIFIAKFDTSGNAIWLKSFGGSDFDQATSVAITPTGHVFIAGYFSSPTIPFGSTTISLTGTSPVSTMDNASYYVAKFDSSGNAEWATSPVGQACAYAGYTTISVASDNTEHAVVTGILFWHSSLAFGATTLADPYFESYTFLARYSTTGTPLWAKEVFGINGYSSSVAVDPCSNIWMGVSMEINDTIDGHVITVPAGAADALLLAYFDSSGNYITSTVSPTGGDDMSGIGVDGVGNVYIGGDFYFGGGFTFGSNYLTDPTGNEGLFAAKYAYVHIDTTFIRKDSCISDSAIATAPPGFTDYLWSDGGVGRFHRVHEGTYWVYCTGICGMGITVDTFRFTHGVTDTIYHKTDTTICSNASLTLTATAGYTTYLWSTGASGNTMVADSAGTYWVIAVGNCTTPSTIDSFKIVRSSIDLGFSLGNDTTSCGAVTLRVQLPIPASGYLWQDGSTTTTYTATASGTYYVTVTRSGCSFADTVKVTIPNLLQHFTDTTLCREKPIQYTLNANVPPGAEVLWSTGSNHPSISVTDTGKYWVEVTDAPCTIRDSVFIHSAYCDCDAIIPSAFTPNQDGINDFFRPIFEKDCEIHNYEFAVFNRWGQRVFFSLDPRDKWDGQFLGTQAELCTYMYFVKYSAGTQNKDHLMKGDVTLIR